MENLSRVASGGQLQGLCGGGLAGQGAGAGSEKSETAAAAIEHHQLVESPERKQDQQEQQQRKKDYILLKHFSPAKEGGAAH